ncbi:enoyl-CoA hydratase/isomerase family protein [Sulfitobacter sp. LCG007]
MNDLSIRRVGQAGRITLTRPAALNALSHDMCLAIEAALDAWRDDSGVALLVVDADGEKAFCAGGDLTELYATGRRGDFAYGQRFWTDEYRLNAKIAAYPKPVVSFMQGFVMGGGVGIGCHCSHRITGESTRISLPECGIGLVPDVGSSYLLARAPGRCGDYLGTCGVRMGAADAIHAGFADLFIPQDRWDKLISLLERSGDTAALSAEAAKPGDSRLAARSDDIDSIFGGGKLSRILEALQTRSDEFANETRAAIDRASPLSVAATLEILRRLRQAGPSMALALELEYRFTSRSMAQGDFLEGIRAAIIDKDRKPQWRHSGSDVSAEEVDLMLDSVKQPSLP